MGMRYLHLKNGRTQTINGLNIMKGNQDTLGDLSVISLPTLTGYQRRATLSKLNVRARVACGATAVLMTDLVTQLALVGGFMSDFQMDAMVFALDECKYCGIQNPISHLDVHSG